MVKADSIRSLRIKPGTLVGLMGDYEAPSLWSNDEQVEAVLKDYLVLKRNHPLEQDWDVAALSSLIKPLQTVSTEKERFVVNELILVQRYLNLPWEDDKTVLVYGVRPNELLGQGPLSLNDWLPKAVLLSYEAMLTVIKT